MRALRDYLYESLAVFLFCTAMTLLFGLEKNLAAQYRDLRMQITQHEILYEKPEKLYLNDIVTKDQLIGILLTDFSYDMEIDGQLLRKEGFNAHFYPFASLSERYAKDYEWDDKTGQIIKVIYRKV